MGSSHSYAYYNQIQPLRPQEAALHSPNITCIIEPKNGKGGLFLGNVKAAGSLQLLKYHGIASVLTVAVEANIHYGGKIPYHLIVNAVDVETYDLGEHAEQAIKFLATTLKKTNVLVHCIMGVSRSASIVIWHLMTKQNMSLNDAFNVVKQKRPIINPNRGFLGQLKNLEAELAKKKPSNHNNNHNPNNQSEEAMRQYIQNINNGNQLRYSGVQIR